MEVYMHLVNNILCTSFILELILSSILMLKIYKIWNPTFFCVCFVFVFQVSCRSFSQDIYPIRVFIYEWAGQFCRKYIPDAIFENILI